MIEPDANPAPSGPHPPGKTLVIHIGDHKTGSTSIQYAFARAQVTLPGASVFYRGKMNHSFLRAHCEAFARPGPSDERKQAIKALRKLARRIDAAPDQFCLLSAESLEGVDPAAFRTMVDRFFAPVVEHIRIIAYVRPHAARFLSNYAEQIKIGSFDGDLDAYFTRIHDKNRLHYLPRFQAWREQFGARFVLRPMIREQLADGSVLHDFIRHGLGCGEFQIAATDQANASLCLEDLMRLKVLQSHQMHHPQKLRHALGWEFARVLGDHPDPDPRTRLQLHKAIAERLCTTYLDDARAIDRAFFDGAPLLENELNNARQGAREDAQPVDPPAHLGADELRGLNALSAMVAGMAENQTGNWPGFFRQRHIATLKQSAQGLKTPPESTLKRQKTLIFHIGDHKTGTSSIQYAFARGQVHLDNHSVFYPTERDHNGLKKHIRDYRSARDRGDSDSAGHRAITRLARAVHQSDADFVLISGESLEMIDPALFHEVVTTFFGDVADEIRVVAYVRPHASRILAKYGEHIKIGLPNIDLEWFFHQTLNAPKHRFFAPRFQAWRTHFGDQFTLRPFLHEQLECGSVLDDFIRHGLGVAEYEITGQATANESPSVEDLMRLKVLHSGLLFQSAEERHALGWEFSRVVTALPAPQTRTRLGLHKPLAEEIRATYLEDARAVDRAFFGAEPLLETALDTAVNAAVDEVQSSEPADFLSNSEIRSLSLLTDIIAGMLENDAGGWTGFWRSKRIAALHL